jgi:steroid 5-alpha reductase family enzyme
MEPLLVVIVIAGAVCAGAWTASLATGDTSWVDRIWSIVPVVYTWVFAGFAGFANARLDVMASIVTLWGARLTFNFARKGGYSGVEDYRWPVLRASMSAWRFQLFNLLFIVIYQNFLLVLISLPAWSAYENRATSFHGLDLLLAVVFLACTALETVADQQQWDFQTRKRRELEAGRTASPRSPNGGLSFSWARWPPGRCSSGRSSALCC